MVLRIGHRGASGQYPENTMLSFERALDLDVDMVELDVKLCRSGELVVIHDETVDRTTDGSGKILDLDLREIKELDAGSGEMIPTLVEVLELVRGRCGVNVELKALGTAEPVGKLVREMENVLVSSFHPGELYDLFSFDNSINLGFLIDKDPRGGEEFIRELGGYSIHPRYDQTYPEYVDLCHGIDLKVIVWTVNDEDDITKMVEMGVDGIISDYPERVPQ